MNNQSFTQKDFELIVFKLGKRFLQYVLNHEEKITDLENILKNDHNHERKKVLAFLKLVIADAEVASANNQYSTIKQYLFSCGSEFNKMRIACGGYVEHINSDSVLLKRLFELTIEYYPSLLLSEDRTKSFGWDKVSDSFPLSKADGDFIYENLNGVLKDLVRIDGPFKSITYRLSNGNTMNKELTSFSRDFIMRAFLNCCYRMKYDLQSVLREVENQLNLLTRIANKESVEISFFRGIYGLHLDGVDECVLSKNIILRNITEIENPIVSSTASYASGDGYSNIVVGCILEYRLSLDSFGAIIELPYESREENAIIETEFSNFLNAIILTVKSTFAPIEFTFFDSGYPLATQIPHWRQHYFSSITILDSYKLSILQNWFRDLNSTDAKHVSVSLGRIQSAVNHKGNYLNSILDGVIAWESMFSSKISTRQSVCRSIEKILEETEIKPKLKELKNFYDLRSTIVHGSPQDDDLFKGLEVYDRVLKEEEIQQRIVHIALETFKTLIKHDKLLPLTPSKRVEHLLKTTIKKCDCCNHEVYEFH